uniref:Uncharacterized protein AlNc14C2G331 n=1 Tax=Albugo laibachii Nc14 TaxID=890382 RepID=F0VZJ3_9STRA|nr:conserved hypothetical protein [Albugo laibachii Nc14]|eukprot:CCA14223.1 conserved hypothetical protein [Albugo laibachii Nc14]
MESTKQFAVLPTLRNGSNQASTSNGISPQHKSGQNSGCGFLYGTNLSFHNHNSVPQKYAHESLYHPEHGTVTYYNDQMTSNISNQNTLFTSFPIGYHVPLSSHSNGTHNFQFPEHEHVGNSTTAALSSKVDHENDNQPIRSGLGLLVESATSNSSGRDPSEADGPNGTGFYTVPFDVSGGTHAFHGTHGVTSRPPASSDIGPLSAFADTSDYLSGSRSRSIEQQHNASNEHGYIRIKEPEGFWRYGPMSPIGHAETMNQTVPSTMVPLVSPTTNMYHLLPDQLVQCTKLHPQVSRSHHVYSGALRQPHGTHPPTLQDHYDGSSKTTSQSKESQGLCAMCGLSQTSFLVEPCGHFYHTQCAASLRRKAQKVCFCGQEIHHFRWVCQSHGQNPEFTSKRVSDNLPEFCEHDISGRSGNNLMGRNDPAFDVPDSISLPNREMLGGPECDSNHVGNHPPNLFMIDSNQYFIRNGYHTTPSKNAAPMAQSTGSKVSRREYRKLRTCAVEGCNRTIRSRGLCKAHGGGKRCDEPGCNLSDQGGGRCINHGGGKRCQVKDCKNSAQSKGLCKQHGGGSRCTHPGCSKSSQGYGRCRAHGGGRRCRVEGCEKTDRRGGYCVTHGADRKCTVLECMKTARMQGLCTNHYFGKHPVPGTRNTFM